MLSRDRTPAPAAALPAPAPLPSLQAAFSRRAVIFGSVTAGTALMAGNIAFAARVTEPPTLDPADAKLVALADAYEALDRQVNATLSTAPGFGDLVDAFEPIEGELASTAAASMVGLLAKARAMQVPAARECADPELGNSLADDLVRLHTAGVLS